MRALEDFVDPDTGEIQVKALMDAYDELVTAATAEHMAHRREVGRLKAELGKVVKEDDPAAEEIKGLLRLWWVEVKGSDKLVKYDLKGSRAPVVKKALKRHGREMCEKAILGIRHDPWAMGQIKKSGGKSFNCIAKHILADDDTVETWVKMYNRHQQPTLMDQPEEPAKPALTVVPEPEDEIVTVDGANLNYTVFDKARRNRRQPAEEDPITRVLSVCGETRVVSEDRWLAYCPCHEARSMKLQITRGDTGCVLLKCWSCDADLGDIVRAWGLEVRDLWDGSDRDLNARGFVEKPSSGIPSHLQSAMAQMLGREERRAA